MAGMTFRINAGMTFLQIMDSLRCAPRMTYAKSIPTVFRDSGNGPRDRQAKPKLHLQTDMIRTYRQRGTSPRNG